MSVREGLGPDVPIVEPSLTCLFEEPRDSCVRLRMGTSQLDATGETGFLDDAAVGPSIWPGCLPRLTCAGRALETQDIEALSQIQADEVGGWFEVAPYSGVWRRTSIERVTESLNDMNLDVRKKPFYVRAAGSRDAVREMLQALRDSTRDEASGA